MHIVFKKFSIVCGIIILIIAMLIFPSTAYATSGQGGTLQINSQLSKDKKTVVVELNLTQNISVSMMLLTLDYELSVFTLTEVERGDALGDMGFQTTTQANASPYRLMWSDGIKNNEGRGIIARLTFDVKDDVQPDNYSIGVTYKKGSDIVRFNNMNAPTYVDIAIKNSVIDLNLPPKPNLNWIFPTVLVLISLCGVLALLYLLLKDRCFARYYENLQLHKRSGLYAVLYELAKYKGARLSLKRDRLKCYMADKHLFDVIIKNGNPIVIIDDSQYEIQGKGKLKPAIGAVREIIQRLDLLEFSEYSKNSNVPFIREMCLEYLGIDKNGEKLSNKVNKSKIEFYCD